MRRACICLPFLLVACFSKPKARCGFLCGPGGECPTDYSCVTADNRCHLVENGAPVDSCNEQVIDAPIADAPEVIDAPVVIDAPISLPDVPISPSDAPPPPPIDARPPVDSPPPPDAPEIDAM